MVVEAGVSAVDGPLESEVRSRSRPQVPLREVGVMTKRRLSRRRTLATGAAAAGGVRLQTDAAYAQQAPAIGTNTQTGRTFRGLVRHGTTLDVQELRRLPS